MLKIKWNQIPKEFKCGWIVADTFALVSTEFARSPEPCDSLMQVGAKVTKGVTRTLFPSEFTFEKTCYYDEKLYTREEWELEQWKQAPEWAMYHAIDPLGKAIWLKNEPHFITTTEGHPVGWVYDNSDMITHIIFQYGEDWKQSLRKRPEAALFFNVKDKEEEGSAICPRCKKHISTGYEYKNKMYCLDCCPIRGVHMQGQEKENEYPKVHTIDTTGLKDIDDWNKIQSEIQKRDFVGLKKRVEKLESESLISDAHCCVANKRLAYLGLKPEQNSYYCIVCGHVMYSEDDKE